MMKNLLSGWGLAAAMLAGSPAFAQYAPQGAPGGEARSGDPGMRPEGNPGHMPRPISRADVQAAVDRGFAMVDANHDGVVTGQEFTAFREARRAEMMARHGEPGGYGEHDGGPPPPLAGGDAYGGDRPPPPGMRGMGGAGMFLRGNWFARADANGDGRVTLAEARGAAMAMFDRVDLNRDGIVSPEERRAAMEDMRERRADGGEMAPPGAPR